MALIYQVTWRWDGFIGGPGFTNLFYDATANSPTDALAAATKSRLLFNGVSSYVDNVVTISLVSDVRVLEDTTGDLDTIYTVVGPAPVVCAGGGNPMGPTGGCIDWLTSTVHGTRRIQGRTFLVPLGTTAVGSGGVLIAGAVTAFGTAAEAMRTASGPTFGVWGRPTYVKPPTTPPTIDRLGKWGPAISSRIPTKLAVLTSRRD